MVKFYIFDLDHTVIDSSHRQATLANGNLDLDNWFKNATPEKIANDKLLPLARVMRKLYELGHYIIICTARTMQDMDYQYLMDNNLPYHICLNRGNFAGDWKAPSIYQGGDADLKEKRLTKFFNEIGFTIESASPIMFEDNKQVIERLAGLGVKMVYAPALNEGTY